MPKTLVPSSNLRVRILQLEGTLKALDRHTSIGGGSSNDSVILAAQLAVETANKDLGRFLDALVDEEYVPED